MKKITGIVPALILMLCIGIILPASAEIYRYTDENGTTRFTDDLNMVPVDQRVIADELPESYSPETLPEAPAERTPNEATSPTEADLADMSGALRERRRDLDNERVRLVAEQEELNAAAGAAVTKEEALAHKKRIDQLQQDAAAYEEKRQAFEQELARYNEAGDTLNRNQGEPPVEAASEPEPDSDGDTAAVD